MLKKKKILMRGKRVMLMGNKKKKEKKEKKEKKKKKTKIKILLNFANAFSEKEVKNIIKGKSNCNLINVNC